MQFGCMPGNGTTDAILTMRQVPEKYQAKKKKMYYACVDLKKASDRVPREVVRWAFRKLGWMNGRPHSYGIVYRGLHCS